MARNWSMTGWKKGQKMTLLEAFGISGVALNTPQLWPNLPGPAGLQQQPIQVTNSGTPGTGTGGGGAPPPPRQHGAFIQYARKLLRQHNWASQFPALNSLEMQEAGWNPSATNPSSGAFGIAQALGHGKGSATQGTQANEYGGFGLTDAQAKQANSGDGYWQIVWMLNYIKTVYGSPDAAWAHEQKYNWY